MSTFRAGPYKPPHVKVGTTVHDECYGDVVVEGMTKTPIPGRVSTTIAAGTRA